jgi:hypothetical protein
MITRSIGFGGIHLRDIHIQIISFHLIDEGRIQFYSIREVVIHHMIGHDFSLEYIQLSCLDSLRQDTDLGNVINPRVGMLLQAIQNCMMFSMNSHIRLPSEHFRFSIVKCIFHFVSAEVAMLPTLLGPR